MNKSSTTDIKFFKGVLCVKIHEKVVSDGAYMSIDELSDILKAHADLEDISCSDMSHEQMQQLKEFSKQFATSIGMAENEFDKDNDDLNFNRTHQQ